MSAVQSLYIDKVGIRLNDPRVEGFAHMGSDALEALHYCICMALDAEAPREGRFHINPRPAGGGVMVWIASHPGESLDLVGIPEKVDAALDQFFGVVDART